MVFKESHKINIVLLLFFCLISYCPDLSGDFVFDDNVAIVQNKFVTDPSTNILDIFQHDFWGQNITEKTSHKSYRPFTTLMFRMENKFFGLNSYMMKTMNLFLHSTNCVLMFIFCSFLSSKIFISFLASALFAIHPIHTEVVCGIVGRAELMFALCYLLTLIIYSSSDFGNENKNLLMEYILIFMLGVFGLLFKENAITILPMCIVFDIVVRTNLLNKSLRRFHIKRFIFWRCFHLLCTTIFLVIGRLYIQDFQYPDFQPMDNPISANENIWTKILSQNYLYVLQLWLFICPDWLCFDWALGCIDLVESIVDRRIIPILILYCTFYLILLKSSRMVLLSFALMIVPFLPASGIIKVGFVIAERILYVPSIGFCLLVAIGFSNLLDKYEKASRILYVILGLVMIILVMKTRQRAYEWTSEEKLFSSGLRVCPKNAKVHYNIAKLAADNNENEKAFYHYHKAIGLYPQYEAALMNLGNLYRENGNLILAEKYLKDSIQAKHDFPTAWMNLGIIHATKGNFKEALQSYKTALRFRKNYSTCLYNLGNLYLQINNHSMAMEYWLESVSLNPKQSKSWANILTTLSNQEKLKEADKLSKKALEFVSNDTTILFIRANILGKLKKYTEAESIYLKIIDIDKSQALYYTNLGVLYHRWGKKELAKQNYKKALQINSNLTSVRASLNTLKK